MSLKDTINAARQEVQEAGTVLPGSSGREEAASPDAAESGKGSRRRSAARAKPVRDAAATVRVVSATDAKAGRSGKPASEMTRAERKAERAARRSEEDQRSAAASALLNQQDEFRRRQRLWWIMLGVGFGLTILSFILTRAFPLTEDGGNVTASVVAVVALVFAYVLIIVAFIYDWRRVRPLRKAADDEAARMTQRQIKRLLREDAQRSKK